MNYRQRIIEEIAWSVADAGLVSLAYGGCLPSRTEIARVNRHGWNVEVGGDPNDIVRIEGVVLDETEFDAMLKRASTVMLDLTRN